MNYEANTIEWKPGDLVLHDDDAKRADMLMVVISRIRSGPNAGRYRTRYLNTDACEARKAMHQYRRTVWKNSIEKLHDPARFGVRVER